MLFAIFISSGLFMGWSLGANDAASIFGTAVGSKMIRFRTAAIIASIFVIIGAVFQGKGTSETLSNLSSIDALAGAFTVSLCAAATVYAMVSNGLPVSTTQAIVGAIIGWSAFSGVGVDYNLLTKIVVSWVTSPLLGVIFAAILFILMRKLLRRLKMHVIILDSYIRVGLIIVGAFGAYSLGANNIANVMGVFLPSAPDLLIDFGIFTLDGQQWLFLLGGMAISLGIITYSHKVMNTVGNGILSLTPETAIVVVLSQSTVLFLFSSTAFAEMLSSVGLPPLPLVPVSSTQVVIGSLLGIGLVKGVREVNFRTLGGIGLGWIITPLISGLLTYLALFFVQNVFNLQVTSTTPIGYPGPDFVLPEKSAVNVNVVLPFLLTVAVLIIATLTVLLVRQMRLRQKEIDNLQIHQDKIFNFEKTLNDLEISTIQKENELLNTKLEIKRREFVQVAQTISREKEFLESLAVKIENMLLDEKGSAEVRESLRELAASIRQKMSFSGDLEQFYGQIEETHAEFRSKLTMAYPDLTPREMKLAVLLYLGFSTKEISSLINISAKSVEIARYRLRKKLDLKRGDNLTDIIKSL